MRKWTKIILVIILIEILGLVLIRREEIFRSPTADLSQLTNLNSTDRNEEIINEPIIVEQKIPTKIPVKKTTPTPVETWGVSKQIGEHTWTIKVGEDAVMATPKEIWVALNEYRKVQGSQVLNWDEKLGNYAQERAKYLNGIKSVDEHKGFSDFLENQNGFDKLGFTSLGENISYGYRLNGVHTIEWMYAGDEPHDKNQLDNRWNYVGIGVEGLATCLIFGTGKF